MAYAAVTSLMSTLGLLLQSSCRLNLPHEEQTESLHKKVKEQIQSFHQNVSSLQAFLESLETNINDLKTIEHCEVKIKDAAYDAEYRIESVLENFYKAQNEKVRREAYEEFCKRLQKASESIDSNSRKLTESMKSGLQATSSLVQSFDLPEHSPQLGNNMVGHENELEDVKCKLMKISSDERETMAITGMGGIGKTTFARKIYDDPEIKSHFDILAWVTVSKEYCVRKMLLQLLHCIPSTEEVRREARDDGELAGKLKQRLWKRRYLVVIDDIWSSKAWDDISLWFPDCKGSHILLTTRCGNVASYAAPGKPPHHMSSLSSEKSWELLQSKLLEKVELSPELVKIGKKVAENCHGMPLTITIVAGLLSKCNNGVYGWEQVAHDVKSAIYEDLGRQCEKILVLSYYYLPQHLKACFLYFGIFPEDEEVDVRRLVELWVAEGFLKQADNKSLENIAEKCLQELIDRNLVLVSEQSFWGEVETCKIHDLLHELCLRQARSENFLPVINSKPRNSVTRVSRSSKRDCLMIVHPISNFYWLNSHRCDQKKIRTIVYQGARRHAGRESLGFKNFKMIRVFDLRKLYFYGEIPTLVFDLVHLRYLSLYIRDHEFLPLFNLQKLQILIIEIGKNWADKIPLNIWRMPQLRTLRFMNSGWLCPPIMPSGEEKHAVLEKLQTITGVGPAWCQKEIFALMPNLKNLEIVLKGVAHELWIGISCLPLIEVLRIIVGKIDYTAFSVYRSKAHDAFLKYKSTFPPTLRRLTLGGTCLPWEAMDIVGMLPNLEILELEDDACGVKPKTTWKPSEGGFPRLKFLSLCHMLCFTEWKATEYHFPVLERLFISHCPQLEQIPQDFANIFTLQLIELHDCCIHLAISAQQIEQEQEATFGSQVTYVHTYNCGQAYCRQCHHLLKRNSS
ncbi:putative late blight resistance protein homolog R1A-10 [Nicotiana tomentosiformis]|uniref:putative late blight resistance protein homolog R1A-10 n=1 Tax=Nicotiana tomentosiformis TaxID=4098 RepID=UPI00388CA7BE